MLKYTVYYNDDRIEFISDRRLSSEEIASRIGCDLEDLVLVEFVDID